MYALGAGPSGTALRIESGAIKVHGAGVGTNTTVFIQKATASNISGNQTVITHPLTDGNPNVILIVTPNNNPGGGASTGNNHPIGVFYHGSKWTI